MSHSFSFGSGTMVAIDKKASRSISIARFVAILSVVYIHAYMVTVNINSDALSLQIPEELLYLENLVSRRSCCFVRNVIGWGISKRKLGPCSSHTQSGIRLGSLCGSSLRGFRDSLVFSRDILR